MHKQFEGTVTMSAEELLALRESEKTKDRADRSRSKIVDKISGLEDVLEVDLILRKNEQEKI